MVLQLDKKKHIYILKYTPLQYSVCVRSLLPVAPDSNYSQSGSWCVVFQLYCLVEDNRDKGRWKESAVKWVWGASYALGQVRWWIKDFLSSLTLLKLGLAFKHWDCFSSLGTKHSHFRKKIRGRQMQPFHNINQLFRNNTHLFLLKHKSTKHLQRSFYHCKEKSCF